MSFSVMKQHEAWQAMLSPSVGASRSLRGRERLLLQIIWRRFSSGDQRSHVVTDEGVIIHQADPSTSGDGLGLVWGSVLWPSGISLAKYLVWEGARDANVLELGCGTGIVGMTCAKLKLADHVTLTDSEPSLWPILRKSIEANGIRDDSIHIHELDWRDTSTFLPIDGKHQFDRVLAADVLYSGMDRLFARALASHLPSSEETRGSVPTTALVACPFRKDSPLLGFFDASIRLGLALERLEGDDGSVVGAQFGVRAEDAFENCRFVPLDSPASLHRAAKAPSFSDYNEKKVQIFRLRRMSGTAEEARNIRRVSRI